MRFGICQQSKLVIAFNELTVLEAQAVGSSRVHDPAAKFDPSSTAISLCVFTS
jgi:hypothetical protein